MIGCVWGVPVGELLAPLHRGAVVLQQPRAVGKAMTGAFAALGVHQHQFGIAPHDDRHALGIDHDIAVAHPEFALHRGLDRRLLRTALRRTADMEGAHGQLRARLADRLRGDHADRLADIDLGAPRKITAVAMPAHPRFGLAGQHRTDLHQSRCPPAPSGPASSSSISVPAVAR